MKTKLIILVCSLCLLAGCSKEAPNPAYEPTNWFELKDNPNDELQHLAYQVYNSTGIPIFYNDTIGSEERSTPNGGKPYTYYEILKGGYTLTATANLSYGIPANRNNIKSGIELLRDRVIPLIPKEIHVPSFLLVDTIFTMYSTSGVKIELDAYRSMMTVLVGKVLHIDTMDEKQKKHHSGKIVAIAMADYLMDKEQNKFQDFFAITTNIETATGSAQHGAYYASWQNITHRDIAFLSSVLRLNQNRVIGFYAPSQSDDLRDYIAAVYGMEEADFKEEYRDYPKIIEKYDRIKNYLQQRFQ